MPDEPAVHAQFADDDRFVPSYGKPELSKALTTERAAEATAERIVAELEAKADPAATDSDPLRVARADLAVRRRFLQLLEHCDADGRDCPPRLDDPSWTFDYDADPPEQPPLDAPAVFDLAGWRAIAAELHARACACRTIYCVDSVGVAIDRLERLPSREVQGDEDSSLAIMRARQCLRFLRR